MANPSEATEERTFQYQDSLPPLPVPSLEESLRKYLESVKPFLNQEEYQRTLNISKDFEDGIGKELQQKLEERARTKRNWLEEWWLNAVYLESRVASQINVNYGGPAPYIEHYWPAQKGTQIERGAIALWYILKFWDLLRKEKLPVHKSGNMPMDMDQFRMLFSTCKVPGITRDSISNYFKTEREGSSPSHFVVMCRGRQFTFDALHEGSLLTPPELGRQLDYIHKKCHNEPPGPGVGALTSEERTRWAKIREYLISLDPKNLTILENIQSSLGVVALDDASPHGTAEDYSEISLALLAGDPTIRWGDKSYNCLTFANGTFGSNSDHAPFDAMVTVIMCYYIDQELVKSEGKWKGSPEVRDIPLPEELVFTLDEKLHSDIRQAKDQYFQQAADLQLITYAFTSFGKAHVKPKKMHPDVFVQLALQLAFYKLYGRPGSCYETITTRLFYHGRTETLRSCTMEAVAWCQSMINPSSSLKERQQLLLRAFVKNNKLMKDCQNGKGFDRHLFGLQLIAKEEGLPTPELFSDPAFSKSGGGGNFVLSTSLLGYTTVLGAAVPMIHDGYGVFYRIRDDRFVVSCTAWKSCATTDPEKLVKTLFQTFHEMAELVPTPAQ
ncbi:peroxisomal carnitine O-octanoyltransferase-like isoform X2 [Lissotriton helveticus]